MIRTRKQEIKRRRKIRKEKLRKRGLLRKVSKNAASAQAAA